MIKIVAHTLLIYFLVLACSPKANEESIKKWKEEIVNAERDFAKMAREEGVPQAFVFYAAKDAVLNRNNKVLKGKEAIKAYFDDQILKEVNLQWTPDFVDVSSSGDLGYTYGNFTFTAKDTTGNPIEAEGVFHTVWKRQADGSWRFVWD